MTPYYEDDYCTIYHGDCREVLPALSNVGLVLTSPPYNLREGGHVPRGTEWSELESGYNQYKDDLPHDEYVRWQRDVIQLCWDSLNDHGAIYYQHKPITRGARVRLPFELVPPDLPVRQVVTWDRRSGFQRTFCHYVPRYEWVIVVAKESFRITTRDVFDLWEIPCETGSEHPAPFPLALAARAISTTAADLIVDPFMGSGTTLRAAKDLGRKAIGIEQSERYCEIAAKRLAQEVLDFGGVA